jgi:Family of unknown function (DUF6152)
MPSACQRSAARVAMLLLLTDMGSASAHHSFAMYDDKKVVTLDGTVQDFQWTNPHVILDLLVASTGGAEAQVWTVELTSPGNLTRGGWTRSTVTPGDKIQVQLHPLRDGRPGGGFMQLTLPDGRVLKWTFGSAPPAS